MSLAELDVGYDVPAAVGILEADIVTPCLILDLDALERNIAKMAALAKGMGVALRAHGKMHKSADVARLQMAHGAVGVCCQKVSEAEAFVRGGIMDVLVSNQVRGAAKIDRLARLPKLGATVGVCVDDIANIAELSAAATRHGTHLTCLVEVECGAERCGVGSPAEVVAIAQAIKAAPNLTFSGLQAYQGAMQHLQTHAERKAAIADVLVIVRDALAALEAAGIPCPVVTGAGTGSFEFEGTSGVYTEIQCGSYAFMDADYGRLTDANGARLDAASWENALFLLTTVMSTAYPGHAICDAGLKAQSVDSGLPVVFGRDDVAYIKCSDEHGTFTDPASTLVVGDRLRLVPGHCDPTCNLHDHYVGVRDGLVEAVWPVTARGKGF